MPAWTQNCTHRRTTVSHTLVHATYIRVPTKLIRKFRLISLIRDFITNPLKPPLVTFCISMFNITNSTFWPQMVFISLNCDNSVTTTASQQVSQQQRHNKCHNNSITSVATTASQQCHNNSVTSVTTTASQQQRHKCRNNSVTTVSQQQRHRCYNNSVTTVSQQRHHKCQNNSVTKSVTTTVPQQVSQVSQQQYHNNATSVTTTASQQQCHNKCHNNSVTTQFFFYFSGETFKGFDAL